MKKIERLIATRYQKENNNVVLEQVKGLDSDGMYVKFVPIKEVETIYKHIPIEFKEAKSLF